MAGYFSGPTSNLLSISDLVLQPAFTFGAALMSSTLSRLFSATFILLPAYIFIKVLSVLPYAIGQCRLIITTPGRSLLRNDADRQRQREDEISQQQLEGIFKFTKNQLILVPKKSVMETAKWYPHVEDFEVCGAMVNVVHEIPPAGVKRSGQSVLLLHGNPSWSYMWRDVIPVLIAAGHEVFAIDWLGHGLSTKIQDPSIINIELHIKTLVAFFDHYSPKNCAICAHDWGGCVALCTGPYLKAQANPRLFLLNTFFIPRPRDISWNCYSLYLLWFLSTGITDGYLPEWGIMRFMAPSANTSVMAGYSAPYEHCNVYGKSSVGRFSHIIPGFSDSFLFAIRNTGLWRVMEGLLGPKQFTNFHAQARLAMRDTEVRSYWSTCSKEGWQYAIAFGESDSLLRDFKPVLEGTIDKKARMEISQCPKGWIEKAGHYPMEERPATVAAWLSTFLQQTA